MNSLFQNSVDLQSQDPKPIMCVSDEGGSHVMPLIKISSEKEMDADILFSPKVADPTEKVNQEDKPALKSRESGAKTSLRESESEGNSMGVLYQSSMGSLHQVTHQHGKNGNSHCENWIVELESRLNSPLLTGNGFVSPAFRTSFSR